MRALREKVAPKREEEPPPKVERDKAEKKEEERRRPEQGRDVMALEQLMDQKEPGKE
jgi:hypothetical protein